MSHRQRIVFFMVLATSVLPLISTPSAHAQVAIIVSKSNNVGDMSTEGVRKFFTGDKSRWANGRRVTVMMAISGTPERAVVLRQIFKMNESEYTKFTMKAVFTGQVQAMPREVDTTQMKKLVADDPGAIGYLPIEEVDSSVHAVLMMR